ncbi:cytochrome P450 3A6-like [Gordionus sp. m RMFG-2023]|uniref:cytochrome P450 3A6-like n=1 Tax=Gordionus sp. m RMFG-2023 TaxID=3053472 RepID=UPI0031FD2949
MTINEEDSIETKKVGNQNISIGISKDVVNSNALLFFIAGYESTANALCWIAHTLASHLEIQETLRQEIKLKISQKYKSFSPNLLNYDDIMGLSYMDQVIKEVLRLHPSLTFFDRVTSEDCYLEDKLIKKGTIIEVPVYALHRDENIWTLPNKFDPDRFDPKNSTKEHQYSYLPFGIGPRNCIGLGFAMLEIKVGLTLILGSNIQFVIAPGDVNSDITPDNTKFKKTIVNFPENGIKVGIRDKE